LIVLIVPEDSKDLSEKIEKLERYTGAKYRRQNAGREETTPAYEPVIGRRAFSDGKQVVSARGASTGIQASASKFTPRRHYLYGQLAISRARFHRGGGARVHQNDFLIKNAGLP